MKHKTQSWCDFRFQYNSQFVVLSWLDYWMPRCYKVLFYLRAWRGTEPILFWWKCNFVTVYIIKAFHNVSNAETGMWVAGLGGKTHPQLGRNSLIVWGLQKQTHGQREVLDIVYRAMMYFISCQRISEAQLLQSVDFRIHTSRYWASALQLGPRVT